uniref:Uncharacterized protein n=1 Tax=Setaria viridis TaxID=4556 RepID=A0A4U6SVK5_SETVI|nr:hypothetical protein SEVIR_9G142566v2 [Setaria viridis]
MGLLAPLLCDALVIAGQGTHSRVNGDKCWPMIFFLKINAGL